MSRFRIAITQRVVENDAYPERRDALAQDWIHWLRSVFPEANAVPVPNTLDDPAAWLEALDPKALILTGGNDWGEAPERDRTETVLVRSFRNRKHPILGVCRGLHVLNLACDGGLCTDIAARAGTSHVAVEHPVALSGEPFLAWAGAARITVNSYHDQGVLANHLADELRIFALAEGDVVEGCVHVSEPILALQWHPERPNPSESFDRRLITALFKEGAFWRTG